VLVAACSGPPALTRLHIEVASPQPVDRYMLDVGTFSALADPLPAIDIAVSDATAGQLQTLQLWGLASGQQVAFGSASVTPILHETVNLAITLVAIACGIPCNAGEVACSNDGTITCELGSDGCLSWSPSTSCPENAPACSNGTCAATCTDECTAGQTACDTAVSVKTCGQFDADACLDWSLPTACPGGSTCSNGICGTPISCSQDGASCDDGNACTISDTCETGTCSGVPKCTAAPAHATPTCALDGSCGFTCNAGYMMSGTACVIETSLAPMPTPRDMPASAVANGKIYVFGGEAATVVDTAEAYDPQTNTWAELAPMPTARYGAGAALGTDGAIYVIGGEDNSGTLKGLNIVEAYHPATNTWTTATPMPTARWALSVVAGPDGLIYAIGGGAASTVLATVEVYNPSTHTWSARSLYPVTVAGAASARGDDGRIYVSGGTTTPGGATYVYDPPTNMWTALAVRNTASYAAAGAAAGQAFYVFGGVGSSAPLADVGMYTPSSDSWTPGAAMPTARYGAVAASVNGLVYVIGGHDPSFDIGTVEVYDPATNTWR
jgi:N-acetylneuraminic acid mutarotase